MHCVYRTLHPKRVKKQTLSSHTKNKTCFVMQQRKLYRRISLYYFVIENFSIRQLAPWLHSFNLFRVLTSDKLTLLKRMICLDLFCKCKCKWLTRFFPLFIYDVSHVYEEYALILFKVAFRIWVSYRVFSGVYSRTLHANRVKKQTLSSYSKNKTCFVMQIWNNWNVCERAFWKIILRRIKV